MAVLIPEGSPTLLGDGGWSRRVCCAAATSHPAIRLVMVRRIAPLAWISAARASSSDAPVASVTIRTARLRSFSFVGIISIIRLLKVLPKRTIVVVDNVFKIIFWAVAALSRVEPVTTSGPVSGSIFTVAKGAKAAVGLV